MPQHAPGRGGRPRVELSSVRRVHLIAVAGVGMTGLAGMLKQRGFEVTGSDERIYPPMSLVIERLDIPIHEGYRAENLSPAPDLAVVGNTVSRNNPEVSALLTQGIPYLSFPEALAEFFIEGHRSVVIAGTHGKTTSTAMLAWALERAGRDPSVLVGGESVDFGGNFKLGHGELFVVEGDEYDSAFFDKRPKFLHYRPSAVLLTSVEFDHADIYRDLGAVMDAFRRLVAQLPRGAPLVVAADCPHAMEVASRGSEARRVTFGGGVGADWSWDAVGDTGTATRFAVRRAGRAEGGLTVRAPGLINVRNALGVYALLRELGLKREEIVPGLESFSGIARRQEFVGEFGGVVVIDDFAHHPTAVAGSLSALRSRYPRRRLWALFEPRSNTSRRRVFQEEYAAALALADRVIVGGVFRKNTDAVAPAEMFSPEQLVAELERAGSTARTLESSEAIAVAVAEDAEPGDVVVMMSNGDFGGLRSRLTRALGHRAA